LEDTLRRISGQEAISHPKIQRCRDLGRAGVLKSVSFPVLIRVSIEESRSRRLARRMINERAERYCRNASRHNPRQTGCLPFVHFYGLCCKRTFLRSLHRHGGHDRRTPFPAHAFAGGRVGLPGCSRTDPSPSGLMGPHAAGRIERHRCLSVPGRHDAAGRACAMGKCVRLVGSMGRTRRKQIRFEALFINLLRRHDCDGLPIQ
jgi:hypothetical protein